MDYPTAADHFRAALALLPEDERFDTRRIALLEGLGTTSLDAAEGVMVFQEALAISDRANAPAAERASIRVGLGGRLRQAGRCEEALAVLGDVVALRNRTRQSTDAGLLLNLANANRDCGDPTRARDLYEQVFRAPSEAWLEAWAWYGLAGVDLLAGEFEQAEKAVDVAVLALERAYGANHPQVVRPLRLRRCILEKIGKHAQAEDSAARAAEIVRNNPAWFPKAESASLGHRLTIACG